MTVGLGWRAEHLPPKHRLAELDDYLLPDPPPSYTIAHLAGPVLDQGKTSSCVAHAVAQALYTRMRAQGRQSPPLPSRRWIYRLARETHGEGQYDDGTWISNACFAMRELGWCTERYAPWDPLRINDPMPFSARRHAFDQRISVQDHAITATGFALQEEIKRAIYSHFPLVFGAMVDYPFLQVADWTPAPLDNHVVGGHAMVAVGYDDLSVHVINSWGRAWGEGGLGRITWGAALTTARDWRAIQAVRTPTS